MSIPSSLVLIINSITFFFIYLYKTTTLHYICVSYIILRKQFTTSKFEDLTFIFFYQWYGCEFGPWLLKINQLPSEKLPFMCMGLSVNFLVKVTFLSAYDKFIIELASPNYAEYHVSSLNICSFMFKENGFYLNVSQGITFHVFSPLFSINGTGKIQKVYDFF